MRLPQITFGGLRARARAMLQKCANPACASPFRRLSEGKLFLAEVQPLADGARRRGWDERGAQRIEHFWLCGECANTLTLTFDVHRRAVPVPVAPKKRASSAPAHTKNYPDSEPELMLQKA